MKKTAVIIGAGPAGLTAAYELLTRSDIVPIVLEKSTYMGGISRTVQYKGNRIDIGGHRFFSKSDRVMNWWLQHLPMQDAAQRRPDHRLPAAAALHPCSPRCRATILMPSCCCANAPPASISSAASLNTPSASAGPPCASSACGARMKIGFSYLRSALFPPRHVDNLEQFFISRFGRELYATFFKSYTEKVWGVPCDQISAEWGAQRIKGLSITKTLLHFFRKLFGRGSDLRAEGDRNLADRTVHVSEVRPRPTLGTRRRESPRDGRPYSNRIQRRLPSTLKMACVFSVAGHDRDGARREYPGDYFFSTMPVQELVRDLDVPVPGDVREISEGLQYRDFITVGLLVKRLSVRDEHQPNGLIKDNWIYIQEPDVLAGRLQIFNNWSPFMVREPDTVWIGVEYFCYESDPMWTLSDQEMGALAMRELETIGILKQSDVLDSTVIRMPKTYPAYFGTYERFDELRHYLDTFPNLFLIGRNGMHKYNNQDHSMLTAMTAVDNILEGRTDKENIWAVNTEMEYHEEAETTAKR